MANRHPQAMAKRHPQAMANRTDVDPREATAAADAWDAMAGADPQKAMAAADPQEAMAAADHQEVTVTVEPLDFATLPSAAHAAAAEFCMSGCRLMVEAEAVVPVLAWVRGGAVSHFYHVSQDDCLVTSPDQEVDRDTGVMG
ncbi:UNVERIFIED_CONTAM: hypothetical protein FKN15_036982 [Acipenser sinensis]